jgi:hypothetical protein
MNDQKVRHPAKFNDQILGVIADVLARETIRQATSVEDARPLRILDPFGGVGRIHELRRPMWDTFVIELEKEWATQAAVLGPTWHGDFFQYSTPEPGMVHQRMDFGWQEWPHDGGWDVVVTSPAYGNRMADHHTPSPEDTSRRNTYRHALGRPLDDNNSGRMQWGKNYRLFHLAAWRKVWDLLLPDGIFVLNVKNHIRRGVETRVVEWHRIICENVIGFVLEDDYEIEVSGLRHGENHDVRVDVEHVFLFRKP